MTKVNRSVYILNEKVDFEEDLLHEFKGHRNLCNEEVPKIGIENSFRRPYSRNLCAFLNTGLGGVVYLGIIDDGTTHGISLTEYQKDHILLSLQDNFQRYNPPVDESMYLVRFIPVVDGEATETSKNETSKNLKCSAIDKIRHQPHKLRVPRYCWCDEEAIARHNAGMMTPNYVVEIEILPWNCNSKLALSSGTPIHPLFQCEDGNYYIRQNGRLIQPTLSEVIEMAEAETRRYHQNIRKNTDLL